jgi:hypothetical protein
MHDLTYIHALEAKNGGSETISKMRKDIFQQLEYFQAEPRYQYQQFIQIRQNSSIYPKGKKQPIKPQSHEELLLMNNSDDESVGIFIAHFILTQKWVSEKVLDELSIEREPKMLDLSPDTETPSKYTLSKGILGGKTIIDSIKSTAKKTMQRSRSASKPERPKQEENASKSSISDALNFAAMP